MNLWKKLSVSAAGAAILCGATTSAAQAANLVTNGSFETPVLFPSKFATRGANTTFGGWTVGAVGNVDHMGTYWQAANGVQSVDLSGGGPGSIFQNIVTQPGKAYKLSFSIAGNVDGVPTIKTLKADFGGFTTTQTFNTTGKTKTNMGWQNLSFLVPGSSITQASTTLTFTSLTNSGFGAVIDNVSIEPVPFEFSPSLGILMLGALGATARIQRQLKARHHFKVSSL